LEPAFALLARAIDAGATVRFALHHPALVTVMRFRPRSWVSEGLWTLVEGDRARIHLRAHGSGGVEVGRVRFSDAGPCRVAKLRDAAGVPVAVFAVADGPESGETS
jgi:hypothetical protein